MYEIKIDDKKLAETVKDLVNAKVNGLVWSVKDDVVKAIREKYADEINKLTLEEIQKQVKMVVSEELVYVEKSQGYKESLNKAIRKELQLFMERLKRALIINFY